MQTTRTQISSLSYRQKKCLGLVFFVDGIFPSAIEMCQLSYDKYKISDIEDVAYFEPFYLKDFIAVPQKKKV